MRSFEDCNPIVIAVHFLSVTGILMFSQNPILLLTALIGVLFYFVLRHGRKMISAHLGYLLLFFVLALLNPLLSHNGKTVLFVVNDAPITLEATLYGAVSAGMMVTALYLFRAFTEIMTRDKLLYVFGSFSPRLALILSMGLRYVPLFRERARAITACQRAIGLYREDHIFHKIKSDLRVFSILITWALENGITTADSMASRGYGQRKRTFYTLYSFRKTDKMLLALIVLCDTVTVFALACGRLDIVFFPGVKLAALTPLAAAAYVAYGMLALLPAANEMEERLKWNCLRSKI